MDSPGFSAEELEFLAEETRIFVIPKRKMGVLSFISGDFGPFQPPRRTSVPFWLAMEMKKRGVCNVVAPEWLSVEFLAERLKEERTDASRFSALPFHYMELSQNLMETYYIQECSDDITSVTEVKSLLQELKEERQKKARNGLAVMNPLINQVDNMSSMEVNECRPFFVRAFETMRQLENTETP